MREGAGERKRRITWKGPDERRAVGLGDSGGRQGGAEATFWFHVHLRCAGGGRTPLRAKAAPEHPAAPSQARGVQGLGGSIPTRDQPRLRKLPTPKHNRWRWRQSRQRGPAMTQSARHPEPGTKRAGDGAPPAAVLAAHLLRAERPSSLRPPPARPACVSVTGSTARAIYRRRGAASEREAGCGGARTTRCCDNAVGETRSSG